MRESNPRSPGLPPVAVGTVLDSRYEVEASIGKRGVMEIFRAHDRATRRLVALEVCEGPVEQERIEWLRERVALAQRVRHPNVCQVYGIAYGPWGDAIVVEHLPGKTLHGLIRERAPSGGVTPDEFRATAAGLCHGLAAMHEAGVVHGDIKPGKVTVTEGRSVLVGFSCAQDRSRTQAREPGAPPDNGTPQYMSPERLRTGAASVEDDVYALGLTLLEMWTCRVPEPGYRPRARPLREQTLRDVEAAFRYDEIRQVFQMLHEDPGIRPQAWELRFGSPGDEQG